MNKLSQYVVSVILTIGSLSVANTASADQLVVNKNGVKIWTVDRADKIKGYKAQTTVDLPIKQVVAALTDHSQLSRWIPNLSKFKMVSTNERQGTFIAQLVLDMPGPIKNRDIAVKGSVKKLKNGAIFVGNSAIADHRIPVTSSYIRIKKYQTNWVFTPISANKTAVTLTGYADPEGSLPTAVINFFTKKQPQDMLDGLKKQASLSKYKNASLPLALR